MIEELMEQLVQGDGSDLHLATGTTALRPVQR
jgi:Tfp pilus assembly pilus retraction ATPase PilT